MSNGDDVLDNWEEFDEAQLRSTVQKLKASSESCERIARNSYQNKGLTTNTSITTITPPRPVQMKLLQRSATQDSTLPKPKSPLDDMSTTFQPVLMVLHKPQDEYQSVNYTPSTANQTVKILRRPTQSLEPRNSDIRPKQPLKTLQQREQEYAEARLRILGSAKNPEDDEQRALSGTLTLSSTITTNSTPSTPTDTTTALSSKPLINVMSNMTNNSAKIQSSPNQYNNQHNQLQQNYQQQQQKQQPQHQQNYFYTQQQQQQQQQQQLPAFNNRTYNMNPLLGIGPVSAIGQPNQYTSATPSLQTQHPQHHLKYQQYHQKSPQQQHKPQQQKQQTWSPVVGGSVSSMSLRQQQNDTILRLPHGPDGTTGFQMHR